MRNGKFTGLVILLTLATLLSACNLGQQPEPTIDAGAVATSAVETVLAKAAEQQTQTALAAPAATQPPAATLLPTTTSVPTFAIPGTPQAGGTALPTVAGLASPTSALLPQATQAGPVCNDSVFISETVPDGTVFKPGQDFQKSWTLQNTGTCTWDEGYALVYLGGTLDGYNINIKKKEDFTPPGSTQVFKVNLTASLAEKEYTECWRMMDDKGYYFGTFVCVTIVVKK
jgi:hypothetical protein